MTTVHELDQGDMIQAIVPIRGEKAVVGALVVGSYVPQRLETRLRGISQSFQEYKQLKLLRQPLKGIYILLFLLMTLVIVFSATWFGLYLARGITEPVQMLAEGTRAVAAGNLDYKVEVRADDEIGILVDSFNRMTGDLGSSQKKLQETYRDLQAKHEEVEQRRRYTETVLEAVATGVLSGAAERMLGLVAAQAHGQPAGAVLRPPIHSEISALVQRMNRLREGTLDREVHLRRDGHATTLLASATALKGPEGQYLGMVLVFDDLTELLKAQRLAAWREVAQRPVLTTYLSGQQERLGLAAVTVFNRGGAPVVHAKDPALAAVPTRDMPHVDVDPDQIKRAVLNLVDNAVEAVGGTGQVLVETTWLPESRRVRIVVADDGPGIPAEDKERLFLPYFSTKANGTGLGLPIVHQIVTDHGGTIWAEDAVPQGTRFVLELPVGRLAVPAAEAAKPVATA